MNRKMLAALLLACAVLTAACGAKNDAAAGNASQTGQESTAADEQESEAAAGDDDPVGAGDADSAEAAESDGSGAAADSEYDAYDDYEDVVYTEADLEDLTGTEHFLRSTVEHIFCGTINKKGNATGYHYDGIEGTAGSIIEGTQSEPDDFGVYTAKVIVDGVKKTSNRGYSSFYPEDMSPQEVVDAINQAYDNRELIGDGLYAGLCDAGFEIDMALTDDGRIITAYPVMED